MLTTREPEGVIILPLLGKDTCMDGGSGDDECEGIDIGIGKGVGVDYWSLNH